MTRCSKCGAEYSGGPHACGQAAISTLLIERGGASEELPDFETESSLYETGAVIGQYRLIELIGEGAIGRVYLAEHLALGRRVALKMVRSELAKNHSIVERFFGEARAVNQIQHENIVEITDFVRQDESGRSYYIMELLEGRTLRALLDQLTALPIDRTLRIAQQICSALEAVHAKGIVHRDLKPENVFLCRRSGREDFVKLLDFGAAKLGGEPGRQQRHQTAVGSLIGTPHYMAPEQTYGAGVDHRTDVYALGVVLYEMVTGRAPFDGETTAEILVAQRSATPSRTRDLPGLAHAVPEKLDALIDRCLAKNPAGRPQSMAEVRAELEEMLRPKRSRGPAVAAAAVVIAAAGAAAAFLLLPLAEPAVQPLPATAHVPVAPPSHVTVTFHSKPHGATVLLGESSLGTTPLRARLPRSDAPLTYELRLDGHTSLMDVVHPTKDATVAVVLAELPKPPPAASPVRKKAKKKRGKRGSQGTAPQPDQKDGIGLGEMRDPFSDK